MSFLLKRGKIWYVFYYNKENRRVERESLRTRDEPEARKKKKIFDAERALNIRVSSLVKPADHIYKLSEALKIYLSNKSSAQTIKAYNLSAAHFISAAGDKYIYQYKKQDYLQLLNYLNKRNISRNTKANYLRHLSAFFAWMVKYNYIQHNFIEKIKPEYKEVKIIPSEHLIIIFEYFKDPVSYLQLHPQLVSAQGPVSVFKTQPWRKEKRLVINKARYDLIKLKYLGAYRASELLHVTRDDFDFINKIVHIKNSKGRRTDTIPMVDDLKQHITQIKFIGFPNTAFQYQAYSGIKSFWNRAMKELGFNYQLTQLRKTRGTELAEKGVAPFLLKKFMRHKNVSTTEQYYINVNIATARDDINKKLLGIW